MARVQKYTQAQINMKGENLMKTFWEPQMDVLKFEVADVITTSTDELRPEELPPV